jgi:diguanylate cyclase (GGDEF)-like protein
MPGKAATKTIEHQCSCSIGIAVFGNEKEDVEQIIKNADSAMYQAKAEGRNRACLFGENTTSSAKASR